jgi:hypothetical protein
MNALEQNIMEALGGNPRVDRTRSPWRPSAAT